MIVLLRARDTVPRATQAPLNDPIADMEFRVTSNDKTFASRLMFTGLASSGATVPWGKLDPKLRKIILLDDHPANFAQIVPLNCVIGLVKALPAPGAKAWSDVIRGDKIHPPNALVAPMCFGLDPSAPFDMTDPKHAVQWRPRTKDKEIEFPPIAFACFKDPRIDSMYLSFLVSCSF